MKIGILTFHSQLNYGGVLQCWALQVALKKMGHDVVVIDRWQEAGNSLLERGFNRFGKLLWTRFLVRSMFGLGDWNWFERVRRTKKFIRKRLLLTPYHFVDWKDAPKDLGVDLLVVGSDQVWHCGTFGDPRAYLLDGAPDIPAIAYAASFGFAEIPRFLGIGNAPLAEVESEPAYRRGLAKFKAISCREAEGVSICRKLGFNATHVVDPTLLTFWSDSRNERISSANTDENRESGCLVCYFMSESLEENFDALEQFARRNGCRVKIFLNSRMQLSMPTRPAKARRWLRHLGRKAFSRIGVLDWAGPQDFFDAFKGARWVVSDSFHALMFSICNGCNVRIVRPTTEYRRQMFSRIEEFADHADGPLVADSVDDALESLSKGELVRFDSSWLSARREESLNWLERALT